MLGFESREPLAHGVGFSVRVAQSKRYALEELGTPPAKPELGTE
jgi:hypothetical protein